jgi:hypothetical protein
VSSNEEEGELMSAATNVVERIPVVGVSGPKPTGRSAAISVSGLVKDFG